MKCHIPAKSRVTRREMFAVREYTDEIQNETFQRWTKLCAVALHLQAGFGHDRIADFLGEISKLAESAEKDEAFWMHIDDVLIKELKFTDLARENYKEVDR